MIETYKEWKEAKAELDNSNRIIKSYENRRDLSPREREQLATAKTRKQIIDFRTRG